MPKISVCIPTYDYSEGIKHLQRSFDMLKKQSFKDFEIVITDDSIGDSVKDFCKQVDLPIRYIKNLNIPGIGGNTNTAILYANGELIKLLYQDDHLAHEDSLKIIVDNFTEDVNWLVTGCTHTNGNPHQATYNDQIHRGINTIGSPSVLTIRNKDPFLFDTKLTWVLDCDYYKRMYMQFGMPKILNDINVVIGIGEHQTTSTLSKDRKNAEIKFLIEKYS